MSFVVVVHMVLGGDLPFMTRWITKHDGGRYGDVDVDDLRLHHFCAPKTCDLNVAAFRMMKGKNG